MARADGNSPVPVASVTPSHLAGAHTSVCSLLLPWGKSCVSLCLIDFFILSFLCQVGIRLLCQKLTQILIHYHLNDAG